MQVNQSSAASNAAGSSVVGGQANATSEAKRPSALSAQLIAQKLSRKATPATVNAEGKSAAELSNPNAKLESTPNYPVLKREYSDSDIVSDAEYSEADSDFDLGEALFNMKLGSSAVDDESNTSGKLDS